MIQYLIIFNFDISKVINIYSMFKGSSKFSFFDLSIFNILKINFRKLKQSLIQKSSFVILKILLILLHLTSKVN